VWARAEGESELRGRDPRRANDVHRIRPCRVRAGWRRSAPDSRPPCRSQAARRVATEPTQASWLVSLVRVPKSPAVPGPYACAYRQRPFVGPAVASPAIRLKSKRGSPPARGRPDMADESAWAWHFCLRATPPGGVGRRRISGRVRSCACASSGAREVPAATSRPQSGGSGLSAPPRGHDRGRARERWPRGALVPVARLEG
jgi:hypothetical protein